MLTEELVMVERIIIAAVLGGIIGFERELKQKPAGTRTHILIAIAACALMQLGLSTLHNTKNTDPNRIIQAIIMGIGFVAGGVGSESSKDKNLTTAATIVLVATIGITVGIGYFLVAVSLTLLSLVTNAALIKINQMVDKRINR